MDSELNPVPIEPVVGGLVWVRRRNGSWWPGRIMDLHELPQSCLLSPRSGTPVKLLGREDASLDWYNLEKSRRVKAFRCGEYDECIEKAKASAAGCNKRAVKYARREDAILHALELEGAQESDGNHASHPTMDASSGKKQEDIDKKVNSPEANATKEMSQSGISFEDPDHVSTSMKQSLQKKKRKTPNDSEDDGTEGTKRMRGLEDLGVGVSPKRKFSMCINYEGSHEFVQMSRALHESSNSLASTVTRSKTSGSFLKRRQSQVAILHENLKRKNRRRQLTKVLESTFMVSVPVLCEQDACQSQSSLQGATNSKISALESNNSKKTSISVVVNDKSNCNGASCDKETSLDTSEHTCDAGNIRSNAKATDFSTIREFPLNGCSDSDGLFDVPFVGDAKVTRGFSPAIISSTSRKQSSEELDESGSTNVTVDVNSESQRIAKRTSKWQLKGKRNFRSHNQKTNKCLDWRRSLDKNAGPDISLAGKHHVNGYSGGLNGKVESNTMVESLASDSYVHWGDRISEPNCLDTISYGKQSPKKREHEKSAVTKDLYLRDEFVSPPIPQKSLPYRLSRFTPHPKYQDVEDVPNRSVFAASLFDVKLEVRASYSGQHVPLVSLMSKLNGKAIVGHPVTVEVWDDGYCDVLFTSIDCCPTSSSGNLYDVPRDKHAGGRQNGSIIKLSPVKNLRVHLSPKKSPKTKKSSILSKKTRRLSSFTIAPEGAEEDHKLAVEKSGGSVLSCIPLKVVFSRLSEALNGSKRPAVDRNSTSTKP